MSAENETLFSAAVQQQPMLESASPALIPLRGEPAFHAMAAAMAQFMMMRPGEPGVLLMDGRTAHGLDLTHLQPLAPVSVWVLDAALPAWCHGFTAQTWTHQGQQPDRDRFCIAASAACRAALVAEHTAPKPLAGVWTIDSRTVHALTERVMGTMPLPPPPLPPFDGGASSASESFALHLMRTQATHLEVSAPEHLGRADLHNVLDILKAISAERRAHDILYVFAEGIARAVPMDRCSVVRVWANQRHGHVLASHEDERVQDLTIDLALYPEIRHVLRTGQTVVVDSVPSEPMLEPVRAQLLEAGIQSMVVVPVVMDDPEVGTLLLRAARRDRAFERHDIGFFEIVAEAASNAIERAHLVENLQLANEHLERLAVTDGLTGLHNHRYFIEKLESEILRSRRYGVPLSCVFLDIDNFKAFNDVHGHLIGDEVLRETAQRIAEMMRKVDTVARYGGEEFTIILPQTDADGAMAKAEMLRQAVSNRPYECAGTELSVTISGGVAAFCADTMEDHLALCRAADRALYISKRNGKNCVTLGGAHS